MTPRKIVAGPRREVLCLRLPAFGALLARRISSHVRTRSPDLVTIAPAILLITTFLPWRYIHRVMEGERTILSPLVRPMERGVYRDRGSDETVEQNWKFAIRCRFGDGRRWRSWPATSASGSRMSPPPNQAGIPAEVTELAFNSTSVSFEDEHELAELRRGDGRQPL